MERWVTKVRIATAFQGRLRNLAATSKAVTKGGVRDTADKEGGDDFEKFLLGKNLARPDDQLDLTEKDLQEEIARMLTTNNPLLPESMVEYSFKERMFVATPLPPHMVTLLDVEGTCLHKESQEAIEQMEQEGGWDGGLAVMAPPSQGSVVGEEPGLLEEQEEGEGGEEELEGEAVGEVDLGEEGEGEGDDEEKIDIVPEKSGASPRPGKSKKLTNQFNFCERAALTYNSPDRNVGTQTNPPPRASFAAYITQWIIYDAYQEDYENQQREKERERKEKMISQPKKEEVATRRRHEKLGVDAITLRMIQAAKILERMINQNTFDDIAQDYRYWEDPSDEYRDSEGTLLPLWKFSYEKTKKLSVTDICWNPHYYDLLGVTFGSFDFMKQVTEGYLCLFTLKNPSYPEYINSMDSGVMCLDFHPQHPYLVVVGLYDGNVAVYNVQLPTKDCQFQSNSVMNKHGGIVWQVCWGEDLQDGEMNFYSVSADGKVYNWVLMLNELAQTLVIVLYLQMDPISGPDGTMIKLTGCGTAIAFHPKDQLIFLVGTEEGKIFKCSTAYASLYLYTYSAHHMPVHRIDFNRFAPEIFISCSADWRVKIWEDNRSEPLFVFDLGCSVGDVKWAPYSSTVFAAVTVKGKVYVFDLMSVSCYSEPLFVFDLGCSVGDVKWAPYSSTVIAAVTVDGKVHVFDLTSVTCYSELLFAFDLGCSVGDVKWAPYSSTVFVAVTVDGKVHVFDLASVTCYSEPLFVFDLGCSVGDVKWAPYSSTVFAAVTVDGKVHVFDLNVNKYKAICIQSVVSKKRNKLTRLAFNHKLPIIIVGDDKGSISTLKLSPNLRIKPKPPKKQAHVDQHTLEIWKLDKLLALVREPQKIQPPADVESTTS